MLLTAYCWQSYCSLTSSVCKFTFTAVGGVVHRGWVNIEVRGYLSRRASDPAEVIAGGEVIPTTGPRLEVTLWRWITELKMSVHQWLWKKKWQRGNLFSRFTISSYGAFPQITNISRPPHDMYNSYLHSYIYILLQEFWHLSDTTW